MHEYVPYVACEDARAAIRWYCHVFAATCIEFIADGPVNVAHAELLSGAARMFVSSVYPEQHLHAASILPTTASAVFVVCAAIADPLERAIATGAILLRPIEVQKTAKIRDPFGHVWILYQTGLDS